MKSGPCRSNSIQPTNQNNGMLLCRPDSRVWEFFKFDSTVKQTMYDFYRHDRNQVQHRPRSNESFKHLSLKISACKLLTSKRISFKAYFETVRKTFELISNSN